MANLLNTIPTYKPQATVIPQNRQQLNNLPTSSVSNPFPQVVTYQYTPARPLSPSQTTPKGIRPKAASGHIVKENIFQSAGSTVESYANYLKYFYNAAFKGEGTDYSVGKINDLAIRTGSLGIAAVLASSKMFPFAKGMEFVGLATWFASMALWPQIIGVPIKAKTGVDINQKYIDSYGRRKFVYEDNQYRPMDLYRHVDKKGRPLSEDEYYKKYQDDYAYLDAVGDKLGIPRDIKNRHEAIMNKMGQVAVQGKTLWMLTAGVMTPVVSSIVADAAQKPLQSFIEAKRYQTNENRINSLEKILDKLLDIKEEYGKRNIKTNIDEVISELGIQIPKEISNKFDSLIIKDCEITEAEYNRLKDFVENELKNTNFGQKLSLAMDNLFTKGGKFYLPKEKMGDVLEILYSQEMNTVSTPLRNELEYLLGKSGQLDAQEFSRLQKFISERFDGSGLKEAFDRVVATDIKYTEPNITLSDKLHEGLSKTAKDAITEALSQMKKEFVNTLPDSIKNFEGLSREDYLRIIRETFNDGAKEMSFGANQAFENMTKRVLYENLQRLNIDPDAIDMIAESFNKHIKKFMDSQRHYIIPQRRMTQLFRYMELNKTLIAKVEEYQAASLMNIAESITANSWSKIPQKYFEALNFTKEELGRIASLDIRSSKKLIIKKLEEVASDPKKYEQVLKTMSKYAQTAISKEEKALIKLVGTADTPGVLSKIKDLMSSVGGANFGHDMGQMTSTFYRTNIIDVQNKFRNTADSFIRPIKALDTFKYIDEYVKNILGHNPQQYSDLVYGHIMNNIPKNIHYHMFEGLSYEQAVNALKEYIKDIVIDKNDINNWTTKFEHKIPGSEKSLKYSLEIVKKVAGAVFGELHDDTARIVGENFGKTCNINNTIMRFRNLAINCKLARDFNKGGEACFMQDTKPAESLAREIIAGKREKLYLLEALIDELKAEIPLDKINGPKNLRNTIKNGYNYNIIEDLFNKEILEPLNCRTSNKSIAEMSGKNISDFLKNAAENIRARNKWAKFTYGLLAGTLALTGFIILSMGRKNYFNKNVYEYKNEQPKGNKQ